MHKIILLIFLLMIFGCTPKYMYIPFKTYYSQPPNSPTTWPQPVQLEDIDGSGIYVYTNGQFWYSGPRNMPNKGWIPIPSNNYRTWYYPLPGQIWAPRIVYSER